MAISTGSTARQLSQMNVTPLIDVLLVLLIIFMVITPLSSRGLNTAVPQTPRSEQPQIPRPDVVLTLLGNGTVLLNHEPVSAADLAARLRVLFKDGPTDVVFLRGEADLEFRQVAEVIDIARGAGLNRIALLTRTQMPD